MDLASSAAALHLAALVALVAAARRLTALLDESIVVVSVAFLEMELTLAVLEDVYFLSLLLDLTGKVFPFLTLGGLVTGTGTGNGTWVIDALLTLD
jgi:hypothetical protein